MSITPLSDFIEKFASVFEETDFSVFTADTKFKELDEWDSMVALTLIAVADEEFNLKIRGNDFKESTTIKELYNRLIAEA